MKITASIDGLEALLAQELARIDQVVDEDMQWAADGLKEEMRDQTFKVLGRRVGNAWKGRAYLNRGTASGPAAFVFSKAPRIVEFFSAARVITPLGKAFAVPTENCPRGPRGRRLSPVEVEARFNAELQPIRLDGGRVGLVIDVVGARSGRGFRQATKGRAAKGRTAAPVLMFTLVPQIRSRKLIDLVGPANRWAEKTARRIQERLGASA